MTALDWFLLRSDASSFDLTTWDLNIFNLGCKDEVYSLLNCSSLWAGVPFAVTKKKNRCPAMIPDHKNCVKLSSLQFLFLRLSHAFAFAARRVEENTTLGKASIKRHNICDLKWQIWHQRNSRKRGDREQLAANAVNFHLSINSNAWRWLTKSCARFYPRRIDFYALLLSRCAA